MLPACGERNPVKRWWFDLEIVEGVAVKPAAAESPLAARKRCRKSPP